MAENGGIYKIIGVSYFADRACLKKFMPLKTSPFTVCNGWQQKPGFCFQGKHIRFQRHYLGALFSANMLFMHRGVAGIQIDFSVIINENPRIKLAQVILSLAQDCSVFMAYQA